MAFNTNYTVIGSTSQNGANDSRLGNGYIKAQSFLQTTNATPTTLVNIPISTSAMNSTLMIIRILLAKDDGLSFGFSGFSRACALYNGASISFITTPTSPSISGALAATAAWSISGNNVILTATGIAATTIYWTTYYEILSVTV